MDVASVFIVVVATMEAAVLGLMDSRCDVLKMEQMIKGVYTFYSLVMGGSLVTLVQVTIRGIRQVAMASLVSMLLCSYECWQLCSIVMLGSRSF